MHCLANRIYFMTTIKIPNTNSCNVLLFVSEIAGKSKTRKWENTEVSPKWILERSYLEKY